MTSFRRTGHAERLFFGPSLGLPGVPLRFSSREAARELLRDLARDAWGMAALRRIYGDTRGVTSICTESDGAVLEGLGQRLSMGEMKAHSVPLLPVAVPYPGEPTRATPTTGHKEKKEKRPGTLSNPRWSMPRVEVGMDLFAIVSYAGLPHPVDATLVISELDKSSAKQEIARIATTVPAGSGEHQVKWKRSPEEAQADLKEDEAAGDSGPLEYRFVVEARDPPCPGESGPLWLTNTVTVKLVKGAEGKKHEKPRVVVLKDALGEEFRVKSKAGEATFDKVLVGPIQLRLAVPHFSALAWSEPRVPVGEPVEAVFAYEDAVAGMKVEVVIGEFNADGTSTETKRLEVELTAASGEARASFTRTEDEAQADIVADAQEGDTGPIEYRYRVLPEVGKESEASSPLWLTHTVSFKLESAADGKSFPDDRELVLVAADGDEHRAVTAGGQVEFENVVCGPMTLKLALRAERGGTS